VNLVLVSAPPRLSGSHINYVILLAISSDGEFSCSHNMLEPCILPPRLYHVSIARLAESGTRARNPMRDTHNPRTGQGPAPFAVLTKTDNIVLTVS
jgi:hypothetical protein